VLPFEIRTRLPGSNGRTGVIHTPHGDIRTPAFIPVGTQAAVKAVLPESMTQLGAQALLANAYHLYLQPGPELVDAAGGLGRFMNWPGPTFTDSGGFQVMSLGSGFKKTLAMDVTGLKRDDVVAPGKERMAHVDEDGVTFKSFRDGSTHRFTPEVSMGIQHRLGADVMFAFDELTTLMNTRGYQEEALERTRRWAVRCLDEHRRLAAARRDRPEQALFGVLQGANYEDLRRRAAADLGAMDFDGYGLGGAIEKRRLGEIVRWMTDVLPEARPRHLLGISEPDDMFAAVENGVDTFDCVSPTRVARNAAVYASTGRYNVVQARFRRDLGPLDAGCDCYTCMHYSRAYLHHLFKAHEMNASTLASIHNERFIVRLVDGMRSAIDAGRFAEYRDETLGRYYGTERVA
jgi:queuine tRNA-ribosyltransferase